MVYFSSIMSMVYFSITSMVYLTSIMSMVHFSIMCMVYFSIMSIMRSSYITSMMYPSSVMSLVYSSLIHHGYDVPGPLLHHVSAQAACTRRCTRRWST